MRHFPLVVTHRLFIIAECCVMLLNVRVLVVRMFTAVAGMAFNFIVMMALMMWVA